MPKRFTNVPEHWREPHQIAWSDLPPFYWKAFGSYRADHRPHDWAALDCVAVVRPSCSELRGWAVAGIVGDINPKTIENAKRQFVELYGSALVMNTYLKIALVLVSLVALGLLGLNFHTPARPQVKPLVVRIDEVGRPRPSQYDARGYQPQAPELRYFLTQFVVKHFSRIRATVQREYPDSLFFLDPSLADATIAQNDQSRVLEMFLTNPSADEIDVSSRTSVSASWRRAVQGRRDLPEGLLHARHAVRTEPRNVRRAGRFRAARPRAERVRARQSAGPADRVLPRRSGVRGGAR